MRLISVPIVLLILGTAVAAASADPGMTLDWKPMSMSLDNCVARGVSAMRKAGLNVFDKGRDADSNGAYGFVWGKTEGYKMTVQCVQKQALIIFITASDGNANNDRRRQIHRTVVNSF